MYLFYNETGRPFNINTIQTGEGKFEFQMSMNDAANNDIFNPVTISTISDKKFGKIMMDACSKYGEITIPTSRFYFRDNDKRISTYDMFNNAVVMVDKTADMTEEQSKIARMRPRNCIILILNKDSKFRVFHSVAAGKIPAMSVDLDDETRVIVLYSRHGNWATRHNDEYIYIDSKTGKKQIKLTYAKVGPDKKYTSNNLYVEDFEGDEFPREPHFKKRFNGTRDNRNNRTETKETETPKVKTMSQMSPSEEPNYTTYDNDYSYNDKKNRYDNNKSHKNKGSYDDYE